MTHATEPYWYVNKLIAGADASNFMLTPHKHRNVQLSQITSGCPLCLTRYAAREKYLESIGYAQEVRDLFQEIKFQEIKYRLTSDGPWRFGWVAGSDYPNCCLDIQPVKWEGETMSYRSNWVRFGWCGIIYDHCRIEF